MILKESVYEKAWQVTETLFIACCAKKERENGFKGARCAEEGRK